MWLIYEKVEIFNHISKILDKKRKKRYNAGMETLLSQKRIFVKTYTYKHAAGDFADTHKHSCWELCYYASGKGKTIIEQYVFTHNKHDIILLEPNHLHNDICMEDQIVYVLQFDYPLEISSAQINLKEEAKEYIFKIEDQLIALQKLKDDTTMDSKARIEKMNELTHCIVFLITKIIKTKKSQYYERLIDYIKSYLYNHNAINYVALEEKTGYSTDRLRKIFKHQVGIPIYKYHSELLLMKIETLLTRTSYSMKAIAKMSGFSSQSMFSQFFSNYCKISPLQYRKLYTNKPIDGVFKTKDLKCPVNDTVSEIRQQWDTNAAPQQM